MDLEFLFALLAKTHAPEWLVRCLRACYRNMTMSFLVNGVEGPVLRSRKGLRQGCPASAILFVFCLDPLQRWLERMLHPAPSVFGYADDLALVLIDIRGSQGAGLSTFTTLLPLATAMSISFKKTVVMPLHRDGVGHSLETLALHLPDWRLACEELRVRYLGVVLGHSAYGVRFRSIIEKMEDRVARIESMRLGMPAAWGLARVVLWSVAHHTLNLHNPDDDFVRAFQGLYRFMAKGPSNWLPHGVAVHLRQLGWKIAPPSLLGLSMRLKLFTLVRLGDVDLPSLWQRAHDAHHDMEAYLLPLSKDWLDNSAITALLDVERRAILGNLVTRRDGVLRVRTCLREGLQTRSARDKLLYTWLALQGNPLADGQGIIYSWLSRRIAWNSAWDSHRSMLRVLALLRRVMRLCPLRVANAVLRLVARGVVLTTRAQDECRCILSRTCGGSHTHDHYVKSVCWATPRIMRRFASVLPLDRHMTRNDLDNSAVKRLGLISDLSFGQSYQCC